MLTNFRVETFSLLGMDKPLRLASTVDGVPMFSVSSVAKAIGLTRTSLLTNHIPNNLMVTATFPAMPGKSGPAHVAQMVDGVTLRYALGKLRKPRAAAARHLLHWLYVNHPEAADPKADPAMTLISQCEALEDQSLITLELPAHAPVLTAFDLKALLATGQLSADAGRIQLPFRLHGNRLILALELPKA